MKKLAMYVGYASLALVIGPPVLFMTHSLTDLDTVKNLMLAATLVWFVTAPVWMKKEE
ncbi:MAG: hypothetical protein RI957_1807 [Verrucomicrobiota bacterium]|jgi:hypothetical protein